ncbi:MAG: MFS transporter, partial [Sphingobacteriales bacterium]
MVCAPGPCGAIAGAGRCRVFDCIGCSVRRTGWHVHCGVETDVVSAWFDHRRPLELKRCNPLGSLIQLKKYPAVIGLAVCLFIVYFASHAVQSVWTFYTMQKFHWDEDLVGYSLGFVGICSAIVQGGLIRVLIPKIGEQRSIWIGLVLYAAGMFLFGIATQGWMMFAFLIPYMLGGICGPALQGVMTSEVPPNAQGELQGGLTSLMALS